MCDRNMTKAFFYFSIDRTELVAQPANVTEMPFKESHMKLTNVSFAFLSECLRNSTFFS